MFPGRLGLAFRRDLRCDGRKWQGYLPPGHTAHQRPARLRPTLAPLEDGCLYLRLLLAALDAAALPLRPTHGLVLEGLPAAHTAEHSGHSGAQADLLPARRQ